MLRKERQIDMKKEKKEKEERVFISSNEYSTNNQ